EHARRCDASTDAAPNDGDARATKIEARSDSRTKPSSGRTETAHEGRGDQRTPGRFVDQARRFVIGDIAGIEGLRDLGSRAMGAEGTHLLNGFRNRPEGGHRDVIP